MKKYINYIILIIILIVLVIIKQNNIKSIKLLNNPNNIYIVSDIHLGHNKYKDYYYNDFSKLTDQIKENDYLVICGDLFENISVEDKEIEKVGNLFKKLLIKNITIFVLAGNHDYLIGERNIKIDLNNNNYPLKKLNKYLEEYNNFNLIEEYKIYELEEVRLVFMPYGVKNNKRLNKNKKNILFCHGRHELDPKSYVEDYIIEEKITNKYDYVFKGHMHMHYMYDNIYSPGMLTNTEYYVTTGYYLYNLKEDKIESKELKSKINFKFYDIDNYKELNKVLKNSNKNDVLGISYSGNKEKINKKYLEKSEKNCIFFQILYVNKKENTFEKFKYYGNTFGILDNFFKNNDKNLYKKFIEENRLIY